MIRASNLYAPGIEQRMAHFQYDNQSWWGREIPKVKAKIPNRLDETEILELAYVMGSQLGRGHSLSVDPEFKPRLIEPELEWFKKASAGAKQMNHDLSTFYADLKSAYHVTKESKIAP